MQLRNQFSAMNNRSMLLPALFFFSLTVSGQQSPIPSTVPLTLAITYYAQPGNRVALRDSMTHSGLRQFESWKTEGLFRDYRVLFSSYLDTDTPTMILVLDFTGPAAAKRWMSIENSTPAGLSHESLSLITSAQTAQMDHTFHGGLPSSPRRGESVFMVIPYEFYVPAPEYTKYMQDYGVPQFEGWLKENVLASYDVYQSRYSASKPWGSLIVFEYRNAEALGQRESIMEKVRTNLQNNPTWKSLAETKAKIRLEREAFIAQELRVAP
jgi:hypothetical protein